MTRRHPNVVNEDELSPWTPPGKSPPPFEASVKRLGSEAAGKKLGCNLFTVPAGKVAVPLHAHHGNEEAIYVLSGRGTARIGTERVAVRPGDWLALPAGEAHAHQMLADQGEALSYLCISTLNELDIVTYPDSGKLLASVSTPPGVRKMFRAADGTVGYFEGEGTPGEK